MVASYISQNEMQLALDMIRTKSPYYEQYINYYEGRQSLNFATVKWRAAFGSLFKQFADNLCAPIVDAAADRLKITGFSASENRELEEQINQLWRNNRMDKKAGAVHEHALKVGDSYVIVWPDREGYPVFTPNPAHQMCVYYDDDGETILWAAKLWRVDSSGNINRGWLWRLNLYFPNSIEKYVTKAQITSRPERAGAFQPFTSADLMWPMPNMWSQVPVFHFANQPEMGVWGQSELWNIVPLQDALNKSIADMLVAMEYVSLPQRWATGLEVDVDENGNPIIPLLAAVNRMWTNPDENGRFGQFEQANLEHFSKVQNDLRLEMARISRTPLHYLSLGGSSNNSFVSSIYPSGESQKVAEAPFVSKLEDRQTSYGDVWESAVAFALKILGNTELRPTDLETMWQDAKPRSETDDLNNAINKFNNLGLPLEVVLAELGYSPEVISKASAIPRSMVQAPRAPSVQSESEVEV